jgi:hypothetical protein
VNYLIACLDSLDRPFNIVVLQPNAGSNQFETHFRDDPQASFLNEPIESGFINLRPTLQEVYQFGQDLFFRGLKGGNRFERG